MKREITFAILIVIMMFAVVGISNTSDFPNFTGFVVGDNVTSNETVETCTEDWSCDSWTECSDESQTRTCNDENTCDTEIDKPEESQSCVVEVEDNSDVGSDDDPVVKDPEEKKVVDPPVIKEITDLEAAMQKAIEEAEAARQREAEGQEISEQGSSEEEGDGELSGITGQSILFQETNCTGCLSDDRCYDFNKRKNGQYCLETGLWQNQSVLNSTCVERYECESNSCADGLCNKYKFMKIFINWFKEFFFEKVSNETSVTNFSEDI